ncbi:hypothetical protein DID99_26360 [Burkholderia sp. Bp8986]|nr:hypothetical protein DIE20_31230 [Burkholderia sp. Bp9131]RQR92042.1 hypothetical protein DIE09_17215 [Burkholderia sp. Bp9010]RQS49366.1 hypothetical protein DID99_26360 [Burkholderia sp. Bp8986]
MRADRFGWRHARYGTEAILFMRLAHDKRLIFASSMRKTHVTRSIGRNRASGKAAVAGAGSGTGGGGAAFFD